MAGIFTGRAEHTPGEPSRRGRIAHPVPAPPWPSGTTAGRTTEPPGLSDEPSVKASGLTLTYDHEQRRELGERIGDRRAAAHHTQESLCEATGLSRSHLQRIESGETDARYSDLLKIAATLGTPVSDLTR
ncbi:helix-turn-helix domain-containing protein [Streptomyces dangxiongensis]|uniref:helix-turn-helix domain-containing protein n=1 Tax=Streptomyces dangxiongensis TaxID=1442032 RepID=UPI0013CED1CD|nr:helix-turn-helix transcriptional regulator [Streptomyces dangxiongensis]